MADRILHFPDDVSVGFFYAYVGSTAVKSGDARGRVSVPERPDVHLSLSCPIRGLGQLRPDDIATIAIQKKSAKDVDFSRLSHLTGLLELNASKSHDVGDAGLAAIAPLRRLRSLDLYASAVTDAGLVHLSGMVDLEHLNLGATRVKGPGLAHLVGLQRLSYLTVDRIGDDGVPHLLRLRGLDRLVLRETRLTEDGVARLRAGFPGIRELYVEPSEKYSRARAWAREGVLAVLAGRLRSGAAWDLPDTALRAMLPVGSRIAEIWREGSVPRAVGWSLDDLDRIASTLGTLGPGYDLRIVTPMGMDFWIPWLRARR
ncbi:MAG TPA: hypothetical protein VFB89_13855, partial [Gemmatimonadales bacterium]|nr:hypothetical protein [Gemmatimonadales bacterium]